MAHRILIPTPLRPFADRQDVVEIDGGTVGELLQALVGKYADLRRHLYNDDGKLRSFVNVYVNDEDIRHLDREKTALKTGDTISIVPSVAGGSDAAVHEAPELTREEVQRYSRHLIMPEVGMDGQRKLKAGSVVCVGAGGLGSPAAMYLAAAGIGKLGIIDFDTVDASNLHRQIIYGTADVGRRKLEASGERIASLNPGVKVVTHETALTSKNALDILSNYDVVLDGTDNFQTRYLVNDACVLLGKPNAYGSIFRFDGQASVFAVKGGPCYRCLYPEPPPPGLVPSCAEGGVLGVLPGVIGIIQATEAIKLIIGAGQPLIGRLLLYDALQMRFRELKLRRDVECPVCGDHPTIKALVDYDAFCGITPPQAQSAAAGPPEVTAEELKKQLDRGDSVFVLDVREPNEYQICKISGSKLIPLGELAQRTGELERDRDIVVHCKMGGRSAKAVALLQERGFTRVRNLKGGILAWIDRVDPTQSKY
jgi:molybdopterin/thiamine biosynthesis adenylyltransferase/rhodanese-related sulfurtransferase/molybdopterin converting factor small subunit